VKFLRTIARIDLAFAADLRHCFFRFMVTSKVYTNSLPLPTGLPLFYLRLSCSISCYENVLCGITSHFSRLKCSCHSTEQACSESRSIWSEIEFSAGVTLVHNFVSSANIFFSFIIQFGSSLTNRRKSSDPSIDPCGTPFRTFNHLEKDHHTPTLVVLR